MSSIENEMIELFEKYFNSHNLYLKNIESCEYILTKYKNKLHVNSLGYRLASYICNIDKKYDINDVKVVSWDNYSSNGETVDKMSIKFKDYILNVKYEMVNDVYFTNEGKTTTLVHKFFIDNCLIFKCGTNDKYTKESINLSHVEECINKININVSIYEFLSGLVRLFGTNIFDPLIQKVGTSNDREKYFFNKDWESDSDLSLDDKSDTDLS